ncbi:cytochrome b5 reductase [Chloropicon primus]|uniref:Cytochrome b5 reductase n=1 Tax=Chloropicon primus TaxID=1764295 RepID=A0A5B8MD99_9CHLO|nr:cytochrome b5 reductase [Chloropicon primus]UPQ97608.1 cytochrome b5 reductase [Chloropicon primus]|eukprot:QDZ18397.1 cytochrome b5 reductase [Chloropicon primus]
MPAIRRVKHRGGPSVEERSLWPKFTKSEVQKHNTLEDGWVIIYDRVYDITNFAITHPGFDNAGQVSTALAITRNLGKDTTEEFEYTHSLTAWKQLADFQIGVISVEEDEGEDEGEVDVVPAGGHPLPAWLPGEVVNFWQRHKQGLTDQLCRYLEAAGYPQRRKEPKVEESHPKRRNSLVGRLRALRVK